MDRMTAGGRKVAISDYDYDDVAIERRILEAAGCELVALQAKTEEELIAGAQGCAAIINQYATVGAKTMDAVPTLRQVARYGIGVDIVDVEAATRRGILVTNVRDYCTEEVADHAIGLMLSLARHLGPYDRAAHQGNWHWQAARPVYRLRGSVMGVLSFGRIGRAIAARGLAFGFEVIAHDPYVTDDEMRHVGVAPVGKNELVERSDVFMNQAPLTPQTRHFLGEPELRRMKRRAIVVNTGRGPTIDNAALYRALKEGWIAAAGLDDLEQEPAHHHTWSPTEIPLLGLENVIVTPHVGYYSEESIRLCREIAASEVARVLTGQRPHNPVNNVRLADGSWSLPGATAPSS